MIEPILNSATNITLQISGKLSLMPQFKKKKKKDVIKARHVRTHLKSQHIGAEAHLLCLQNSCSMITLFYLYFKNKYYSNKLKLFD